MTAEREQPTAAGVWQRPLRSLTLGLVLVVVAGAFEALAVATVMPAAVRDLGDMDLYGWAFSGFTLSNLIGISVGGKEGARFGAVRLLLFGTLVFCLGLVVAASAPAMIVLVLGRLLQGFGSGLLYTVAYAAIPRAYHSDLRPRMLATLSTAWVLPGLIGPGLAGLAATALGWRSVFAGLLPMPLVAAALVAPALRALSRTSTETPRQNRADHTTGSPSTGDAALAGSGSATRAARTGSGSPSGPAQDRVLLHALMLSAGVGGVLAGLGHRHVLFGLLLVLLGLYLSGHALTRLLPQGTLRARRGQPAAIATMSLITFAFFGAEAFVPLALSHVRDVSIAWSGLPLTAAALSWTAGAWLPVRIAGRVRRDHLVLAGLAVLSAGLVGTALLLLPWVPPETILLSWTLAGLGMGIAFTTTAAAVLDGVEGARSDEASAALQLAQALGASLATGIGGAIVASSFAGDPPQLGIAIVDALMLLVVLVSTLTARGITGRA